MALEKVYTENGVDIRCVECGEVIASGVDEEYFIKNPNASDKWLEELEIAHNSHTPECPNYEGAQHEIVCPDCGEVLGTYDEEYAYNYPNSLEIWEGQLFEEHAKFCPNAPEEEPVDPVVHFEGTLEFPEGDSKTFKIVEYFDYDPNGEVRVEWSKGATGREWLHDIAADWSEAVLKVLFDIPVWVREDFIKACKSALTYEASHKTSDGQKVEVESHMWGFEISTSTPRRRRKRNENDEADEIDEIVEEA